MSESFTPRRGDAIWIDFDPQRGHEQSGFRPAIVLSPERYNRTTKLALVCPITSRKKGYPFQVEIPSGFNVYGVVLADHVKSLAWQERGAKFICALPDFVSDEVAELTRMLLE